MNCFTNRWCYFHPYLWLGWMHFLSPTPQFMYHIYMAIIQCVPLATEPSISLIILTPMKILEWNLNKRMFVVWEMKMNVSVVCVSIASNSCDTEQRSSSQPASQRHFEGALASALARSDAAWLFLMVISERESLTKQTTNHRRLESKHHWRISGTDSGRTGNDFPKYGAPGSILSGRKWWPLPAHVMMSSHFLHNAVSPPQIYLQYFH